MRLWLPQAQSMNLCRFPGPGVVPQECRPATSAKSCPQLCTAGVGRHSAQAGSIHHRATATRTFSSLDEPLVTLSGPRRPRPPSRTISQLGVNSGSPPDLLFNPDKHGSVNWASKGPRGLLTQLGPTSSCIKCDPFHPCC